MKSITEKTFSAVVYLNTLFVVATWISPVYFLWVHWITAIKLIATIFVASVITKYVMNVVAKAAIKEQ